jgi:hypothetical protein
MSHSNCRFFNRGTSFQGLFETSSTTPKISPADQVAFSPTLAASQRRFAWSGWAPMTLNSSLPYRNDYGAPRFEANSHRTGARSVRHHRAFGCCKAHDGRRENRKVPFSPSRADQSRQCCMAREKSGGKPTTLPKISPSPAHAPTLTVPSRVLETVLRHTQVKVRFAIKFPSVSIHLRLRKAYPKTKLVDDRTTSLPCRQP